MTTSACLLACLLVLLRRLPVRLSACCPKHYQSPEPDQPSPGFVPICSSFPSEGGETPYRGLTPNPHRGLQTRAEASAGLQATGLCGRSALGCPQGLDWLSKVDEVGEAERLDLALPCPPVPPLLLYAGLLAGSAFAVADLSGWV